MSVRSAIFSAVASLAVFAVCGTAMAQFPGQNGRIAFTRNVSGFSTVFTVRPDGTDLRRGTTSTDSQYDPSFSPSGKRLAFVQNPGDAVWTALLEGPSSPIVPYDGTSGVPYMSEPVYTPSGSAVIYRAKGEDGKGWDGTTYVPVEAPSTIMRVDVESGETKIVRTPVGYHSSGLAVSPDGGTIAYAVDGDIQLLWRTGTVRATIDRDQALSPSFSPDGTRIVFTDLVAGIRQVVSMRPDGSDVQQISTTPGDKMNPVYSPDGLSVAFSGPGTGGSLDAFSIRLADSKVRTVASSALDDRVEDWQRKAPFWVESFAKSRRAIRIITFGPGQLKIKGTEIASRQLQVDRGASTFAITPTRRLRKRLRHGDAKTSIKIIFYPDGALRSSVRRQIVVKGRSAALPRR